MGEGGEGPGRWKERGEGGGEDEDMVARHCMRWWWDES